MSQTVYYLDIKIIGYEAEIFLNGAPLLPAVTSYPCIAYPTVSEWVVNGDNELKVVIHDAPHIKWAEEEAAEGEAEGEAGEGGADSPPAEGAGAAAEGDEPVLRVLLLSGQLGEIPEPKEEDELMRIDWVPPEAYDDEPPTRPIEITARAAIQHDLGVWSWQTAAELQLDDATRAELMQVLQSVHGPLSQGSGGPLADASELKLREVAPCYGYGPDEAKGEMLETLSYLTADSAFSLRALDPAQVELRLCCGGRVVEPRFSDGRPILQATAPIEEALWSMPIFLARLDGQLTIVR